MSFFGAPFSRRRVWGVYVIWTALYLAIPYSIIKNREEINELMLDYTTWSSGYDARRFDRFDRSLLGEFGVTPTEANDYPSRFNSMRILDLNDIKLSGEKVIGFDPVFEVRHIKEAYENDVDSTQANRMEQLVNESWYLFGLPIDTTYVKDITTILQKYDQPKGSHHIRRFVQDKYDLELLEQALSDGFSFHEVVESNVLKSDIVESYANYSGSNKNILVNASVPGDYAIKAYELMENKVILATDDRENDNDYQIASGIVMLYNNRIDLTNTFTPYANNTGRLEIPEFTMAISAGYTVDEICSEVHSRLLRKIFDQ